MQRGEIRDYDVTSAGSESVQAFVPLPLLPGAIYEEPYVEREQHGNWVEPDAFDTLSEKIQTNAARTK